MSNLDSIKNWEHGAWENCQKSNNIHNPNHLMLYELDILGESFQTVRER